MDEQLTSDPVATPKTDKAAFLARQSNASPPTFVVSADFAREQELRIAKLELALNQIKNGCVDEGDTVNEWYRSAPQEIRKICLNALEGKSL